MLSGAVRNTNHDRLGEVGGYFVHPEPGIIRVSGVDRSDYIQRQTTNDVRLLSPERALQTVLTNPSARILDVFHIIHRPDSFDMITLPGRAEKTARYLQGRIFFMDKVTVVEVSGQFVVIDIVDPANVLDDALGFPTAPQEDEVQALRGIEGDGCIIGLGEGWLFSLRLVVPRAEADQLVDVLSAKGLLQINRELEEALRIEAGIPGAGELTENYTPLETGIGHMISDTKGCYTGQEVIARQITYDKVTKHLVGIRGEHTLEVGMQIVTDDGKSAGSITSASSVSKYGNIALAVVSERFSEQPLSVLQSGVQIRVETLELPFS